ncbi:hypothetical protein ACHAXR_009426, partial [Thalassiosira sp. AJA248-18]
DNNADIDPPPLTPIKKKNVLTAADVMAKNKNPGDPSAPGDQEDAPKLFSSEIYDDFLSSLLTLEKRTKGGPGSLTLEEITKFEGETDRIVSEMKEFLNDPIGMAKIIERGYEMEEVVVDAASVAVVAEPSKPTPPTPPAAAATPTAATIAPPSPPAISNTAKEDTENDEPPFDGTGFGLARGTTNTYAIPNMDEMSAEEYRAKLQETISARQAQRRKAQLNAKVDMIGNRSSSGYLDGLSGGIGPMYKAGDDKQGEIEKNDDDDDIVENDDDTVAGGIGVGGGGGSGVGGIESVKERLEARVAQEERGDSSQELQMEGGDTKGGEEGEVLKQLLSLQSRDSIIENDTPPNNTNAELAKEKKKEQEPQLPHPVTTTASHAVEGTIKSPILTMRQSKLGQEQSRKSEWLQEEEANEDDNESTINSVQVPKNNDGGRFKSSIVKHKLRRPSTVEINDGIPGEPAAASSTNSSSNDEEESTWWGDSRQRQRPIPASEPKSGFFQMHHQNAASATRTTSSSSAGKNSLQSLLKNDRPIAGIKESSRPNDNNARRQRTIATSSSSSPLSSLLIKEERSHNEHNKSRNDQSSTTTTTHDGASAWWNEKTQRPRDYVKHSQPLTTSYVKKFDAPRDYGDVVTAQSSLSNDDDDDVENDSLEGGGRDNDGDGDAADMQEEDEQ